MAKSLKVEFKVEELHETDGVSHVVVQHIVGGQLVGSYPYEIPLNKSGDTTAAVNAAIEAVKTEVSDGDN